MFSSSVWDFFLLPCDCHTTTNFRGKVVIVVRWPLDNQRNWIIRKSRINLLSQSLTHNQSAIFRTEASTKVLAAMKVKMCNAFWKCKLQVGQIKSTKWRRDFHIIKVFANPSYGTEVSTTRVRILLIPQACQFWNQDPMYLRNCSVPMLWYT